MISYLSAGSPRKLCEMRDRMFIYRIFVIEALPTLLVESTDTRMGMFLIL